MLKCSWCGNEVKEYACAELCRTCSEADVRPNIDQPNFADGLQLGIKYCQAQIDNLREIYGDDSTDFLNAIQEYIDVRSYLREESKFSS